MQMNSQREINKQFGRIARTLTVFQLMAEDSCGFRELEGDLDLIRASKENRRLCGFYTEAGIRTALDAYGFPQMLKQKVGDDRYSVCMDTSSDYSHLLRIYSGDFHEAEKLLIEVKLHSYSLRLDLHPHFKKVETLYIDWLTMQNPLSPFSPKRPPLPGQEHPGLGISRETMAVFYQMAKRLSKDAIVTVPMYLHNAFIFEKMGFRRIGDKGLDEQRAVFKLLEKYSLALVAWAIERGFVSVEGQKYEYQPVEMVYAVSRSFREAIKEYRRGLKRNLEPKIARLDINGFIESLYSVPLPGIAPDEIAEQYVYQAITIE